MKKIFALVLVIQLVFSPLSIFAEDDTSSNIEITESVFPDALVREMLSECDWDNDGVLSSNEQSSIYYVEYKEGMKDFTGLDLLPNIAGFSAYGITSDSEVELDLTSLKNLRGISILDCSGIKSLDISGLTNLGSLFVNGTSISELDLTGMVSLYSLDVSNNPNMTTLDISDSKNLTYISIHGTSISSLDLSNVDELYELDCSNSKISTIDISDFENLYTFKASGDNLVEVITSDTGNYISNGDIVEGYTLDTCVTLAASTYQAGDEVVIPDTVTAIGYFAFVGDNTPRVIEIPESVDNVFGNAFYNCTNLDTLLFEGDSIIFDEYSFTGCTNLSSIYFSGSAATLAKEEYFYYSDTDEEPYLIREGTFSGLTATVYYPEGDSSWDEVIKGNYSGDITWVAWDPSIGIPESDTTGSAATVTVSPTIVDTDANVVINDTSIKDLANSGEKTVTVVVNVTDAVESVKVKVSSEAIDTLIASDVEEVVVECGIASLSLDKATLETISASTSGVITFNVETVDTAILSSDIKELIGDRPVFDFSIIDEEGTTVSTFGLGVVTVSIPYVLADGEVAENLVIYYLADNGDVEEVEVLNYDEVNGVVTFEATHFSSYAVGYAEADDGISVPATGDTFNYTFVVCAIMSLGAIYILRKKKSMN